VSDDNDTSDNEAAFSRESLADQLRQLEAYVETAESQGDTLPPEAVEMVARLKEIMEALDGLTTSLGAPSPDVPSGEARTSETEEP
jgi:hypothetical protein